MCYSAMVKRDLAYLGRHYSATFSQDHVDNYLRASAAEPKRFPMIEPRIFPGHYAPILYEREGRRVIELMRYNAYPPSDIANPRAYTTYNARRDNLNSKFWSKAFGHHHGIVVLEKFYEWVAVEDLLKAGVVRLNEIVAEFKRQAEERKMRLLAAGKKYKPTPTELKDPRLRQTIIAFTPEDGHEMIAPVIFSYSKDRSGPLGEIDAGFAIVTDEPPFEIVEAGHDRCPVILEREALEKWLHPQAMTSEQLIHLLGEKKRLTFKHALAEAA